MYTSMRLELNKAVVYVASSFCVLNHNKPDVAKLLGPFFLARGAVVLHPPLVAVVEPCQRDTFVSEAAVCGAYELMTVAVGLIAEKVVDLYSAAILLRQILASWVALPSLK